MKKTISFLLVIIMVFSLLVPAYAATARERTKLPTVYFRGNSEDIFDEDGNRVYDFDVETDTIKEMAKKILPYLAAGMITNDFSEYYKVFGEEMSKLYDRAQLDNNGNPKYGTGISNDQKRQNENEMNSNYVWNGTYDINSYDFANDWRLDPFATVDDIDNYINGILKATGKNKVNLMCKCLGGDLILAYISKYGTERINAICFGSTVVFGADLADCIYRGKVRIEGNSLANFVKDDYAGRLFSSEQEFLYKFLQETFELAAATGLTDVLSDVFMKALYERIYTGLIPELVLSTYGTWPGYWTMVTAGNYAEARDFIFGKEGSEKYENYKGLIEKLDNYDEKVRQQIPQLLKEAEANGVNICITSKYGFQMPPITEDYYEQGDVWTSAKYSSLGATVSKAGTVLSDDYIASRIEAGKEKYISVDKQVDASTCVFPDYTWFIKGAVHDDWTAEEDNIIVRVCNSDEQLTVDTMEGRPQFLVYDKGTDTVAPMTKENCNTEKYVVDDNSGKKPDPSTRILASLIKWLTMVFTFLTNILNKPAE